MDGFTPEAEATEDLEELMDLHVFIGHSSSFSYVRIKFLIYQKYINSHLCINKNINLLFYKRVIYWWTQQAIMISKDLYLKVYGSKMIVTCLLCTQKAISNNHVLVPS